MAMRRVPPLQDGTRKRPRAPLVLAGYIKKRRDGRMAMQPAAVTFFPIGL